jgi:hypothetical protein
VGQEPLAGRHTLGKAETGRQDQLCDMGKRRGAAADLVRGDAGHIVTDALGDRFAVFPSVIMRPMLDEIVGRLQA